MSESMKGRVCVVTGGASGIGKATATGLAKMAAHVVMVDRNRATGGPALADVRAAAGSESVDLVPGDLSSLATTKTLAETLLAAYPEIHVLVNNAGVFPTTRSESPDGFETTLAVNYYGTYALTCALLDRLKASGKARVVTVSSDLHYRGDIGWDDLNGTKKFSGIAAYSQSKLMNVLFTTELARRLEGTDVTANALHPGVVRTNLASEATGWMGVVAKMAAPFLLTPEKGAATSIHLATSSAVSGVSGRYFAKSKEKTASKLARDASLAARLWAHSEEVTGLTA